jgi:2-hydroxy-6-oxonona-2,4-dienedioate hydrolase
VAGNLTEEGLIKIPGLLSRWVRLGNGAKAHYMTAGETGPAVVLLHGGIPGSSGTAGFRFTATHLAANGFRVYCPDMPGFGWSDQREEHWPKRATLDHIDFIERFADALCLDEFHISGNSMGCINAAHYVVRYPHRVKSFALVAGFIGDHVPMAGNLKDELAADVFLPQNLDQMRTMMKTIISKDEAITDDLLEMRFQASRRHEDAWRAWYSANNLGTQDPDVLIALSTRNRIDKLQTPGIYLYGVNDVICPVELGYKQEDALPGVQFFYVPDCGHQGQTDRPDLFNPVFVEFFRDGKVSRESADKAGVSKRRPELPNLVEQVG